MALSSKTNAARANRGILRKKNNKEEMMVTTGLIVRLTAKAGKIDELAAFLRDALPLVQDEPDTIAWFAVAMGAASFAIIDAFPDEQGRQAHLEGRVAAALFGRAGELLEMKPEIEYVDVVAAKLPAGRDEGTPGPYLSS